MNTTGTSARFDHIDDELAELDTFAATPAMRVATTLTGGATNGTARKFDDLLIANVALHTAAYTPRTAAWVIV